MKILLASGNSHKIREFKEIFRDEFGGRVEIVNPLESLAETPDVLEDGSNFIENAFKKAEVYHKSTGMTVLADDSGLEVEALDGKPGIHSARYAGGHGDDKANRIKLLTDLVDKENRKANFTAVLCLYDGEEKLFFEGKCFGKIIDEERGRGGFGYDPVFVPEGYDKTFAELPEDVKNRISHRALAVQKLVEYLRENV
jgi:XTP/dITP diphosphohydrolase